MFLIYFFTLIFAFSVGLYRYKGLDAASRVFVIYLGTSVLCEAISYYAIIKYRDDLPVYNIDCLVEFGLVSMYFNRSIDVFKKRNIGFYIGCAGILVGIIDLVFIQGLRRLNSYFLVFEGICVIAMALFSFFRLLLRNDNFKLYKYHHFWFATIMAFYWSATFIDWSLFDYFNARSIDTKIIADSLLLVAIFTYSGISSVFILYPKMQKAYE